MILNVFLIAIICSYVLGILDFFHEFLSRIYSAISRRNIPPTAIRLPKILECPQCATMWLSLIYLLCAHPISFDFFLEAIFIALVASFSTKYIIYTIQVIDALISKILGAIEQEIITK